MISMVDIHVRQGVLLSDQLTDDYAADIYRFVSQSHEHSLQDISSKLQIGYGHLTNLFIILHGQYFEQFLFNFAPEFFRPTQDQRGQFDPHLLVGGDLQSDQIVDRLQDFLAGAGSDHISSQFDEMEQHARADDADAGKRTEHSLRQQFKEEVEEFA